MRQLPEATSILLVPHLGLGWAAVYSRVWAAGPRINNDVHATCELMVNSLVNIFPMT